MTTCYTKTLKFNPFLQVSAPYPLSAVVISNPSDTEAVYRISLLPSYHSPPETPFSELSITFLHPHTQQEEIVSVTYIQPTDPACPPTSTTPTTAATKPVTLVPKWRVGKPSYAVLIVTIFVMFLATLVICLAINRTSTSSSTGFSAHLPPSPPPVGMASTPISSPTPKGTLQQQLYSSGPYQSPTSPIGGFGVHSQHHTPSTMPTPSPRKTGFSSSPGQHGLFSQ